MSDDECEVWVGWLDHQPKRVMRMNGRMRYAQRVGYDAGLAAEIGAMLDDDGDARVEAMARAHEPTTGAKTMLRKRLVAEDDE